MVIFDAKRERELIESGTLFWCHSCLVARPIDDKSPDHRYCQGCHDLLLEEVNHLHRSKWGTPSWVPKGSTPDTHREPKSEGFKDLGGGVDCTSRVQTILSTLKSPQETRGRKPVKLPVAYIEKLSKDMGAKSIASKLKKRNINVSYKTVERLLKGIR